MAGGSTELTNSNLVPQHQHQDNRTANCAIGVGVVLATAAAAAGILILVQAQGSFIGTIGNSIPVLTISGVFISACIAIVWGSCRKKKAQKTHSSVQKPVSPATKQKITLGTEIAQKFNASNLQALKLNPTNYRRLSSMAYVEREYMLEKGDDKFFIILRTNERELQATLKITRAEMDQLVEKLKQNKYVNNGIVISRVVDGHNSVDPF